MVLAGSAVALVVLCAQVASARSMLPSNGQWAMTQASLALRMVGLMIWPWGQTLDHDVSAVPYLATVAGLLLCVMVVEVSWERRHTMPFLLFGVLWFVCSLAPRMIVQPQAHGGHLNEHQFRLASEGAVIVLASVAYALRGRPPQLGEGVHT